MHSTRLHRLGAARAKRTIAKNSNETEMLLLSRWRRFNDRDGPSRLLTQPGRRPMAMRAVCSPLVAGCQTRNRARHRRAAPRRVEQKIGMDSRPWAHRGTANEFSTDGCNTNGALQSPDAAAHYNA